MQSSHISAARERPTVSLLEALASRPRPTPDKDQEPSDFSRRLEDLTRSGKSKRADKPGQPQKTRKAESTGESDKDQANTRDAAVQPSDAAADPPHPSDDAASVNKPVVSSGPAVQVVVASVAVTAIRDEVAPVQKSDLGQYGAVTTQFPPVTSDRTGLVSVDGESDAPPSLSTGATKEQLPLRSTDTEPSQTLNSKFTLSNDAKVGSRVALAETSDVPDEGVSSIQQSSTGKNAPTRTEPPKEPQLASPASEAVNPPSQGDAESAPGFVADESVAAQARKGDTRPLVLDGEEDVSDPVMAETKESSTTSNAKPVRSNAALPQARIAAASGDGTAASLARWLLSAKSDDRDSSTSSPPPQLAAAAPATERSAGQQSNASSNGLSAVAHSAGAGRVAQLLGVDQPSLDNIDSIARSLSSPNAGNRQQVTLQLDPPELGRLRLDIRMEAGEMSLRVDAQTASAAKLIESRMPDLREALATHGIRVDRTDIIVRTPESNQSGQQHDAQGNSRNAFAQHDANSDAQGRGWFSGHDSSSGHDQTPWSTNSPETLPFATVAAASIADAAAMDSNRIQTSLNLVA